MKNLLASLTSLAFVGAAFLVTPPPAYASYPSCNEGGDSSLCAEVYGVSGTTFCRRMLCSDAAGAETCTRSGQELEVG